MVILAAALPVIAGGASSADAQTWTPAGTAVGGTAANPTLTYGAATLKCDTGTVSGATTNPASATLDVSMTLKGNCNISGLSATVTCTGPKSWKAIIRLAKKIVKVVWAVLTCVATIVGICEILFGTDNTADEGTLDQSGTTLTTTVTSTASRTGSSLCGPASGAAAFQASWNLTPSTLAIT
jgi:hypothetical protein